MDLQSRPAINDYYVDIVMCIDASGSMPPIVEELKENALSFYPGFVEEMGESDMEVAQLRIKVIAFRDYGCDEQPMLESPFYTLPDENEAFKSFLSSIVASGGGDGPKNALEAIALALKSDWTTGGTRRLHFVMVFTDAPALPLGARADAPLYPSGMPADLAELGAWWHGTDPSFGGTYQPKAGRLVAYVPAVEPWTDLQAWDRYWPAFDDRPERLTDLIQLTVYLLDY